MGGHQPEGQRSQGCHLPRSISGVQIQYHVILGGENVWEVSRGIPARSAEAGGGSLPHPDAADVSPAAGKRVRRGGTTRGPTEGNG